MSVVAFPEQTMEAADEMLPAEVGVLATIAMMLENTSGHAPLDTLARYHVF